jgi:hypothetical protein
VWIITRKFLNTRRPESDLEDAIGKAPEFAEDGKSVKRSVPFRASKVLEPRSSLEVRLGTVSLGVIPTIKGT